MGLTSDVTSQFAKLTANKKEKVETTINGTFKNINGKEYVQLDGSDILTPVVSTVTADTGDRVKVLIKDHTATITGNITSPSARSKDVSTIKDEVDEFGNTIKQMDNTIVQQGNSIIQMNNNINQHSVTLNQHDTAINQQGDTITSMNNTITQQNNNILQMNNNVISMGNQVEAMNNTVDAQNNQITAMSNTIQQMDNIIIQYGNTIEQQGNTIVQFGDTIKSQNNTIIQMDNVIKSQGNSIITMGSDILILNSGFQIVDGKLTGLSEAVIDSLRTGTLNAEYATIDFSNIGEAAVEKLFTESGIIKDLVMSNGQVTGELIGVVIKGDIIEANTIKAESLIVRGENGLYYRLNHTGETFEAEQTDENSLNGQLIAAKSITATKIAVDDLVAFGATIGRFIIGDNAIYSAGKGTVDATTPGIYLGSDGQMCIGDDINAIKFYKDENGEWKLGIRADTLQFGANGISVEYAMGAMTTTIQNSGGSNLLRNSVGYANDEFWTVSGSGTIETYQDEQMSLSGSKFIITGPKTLSQSYITEIGSSYMISCKIKHTRIGSGGALKIEIKDANNANNSIVVYNSTEVLSDWTIISLEKPYAATVLQPILNISVDGNDKVEITDLIINNGDTRIWSPYFDELYGSGHRLDRKGLKFYNTKDSQESMTSVSGIEFKEHDSLVARLNGEEVFSRTSRVTESQILGKLRTVVLDADNIIEYV